MKTKTGIITLLGVWALCCACLADELHVPSEYATIQAAIDAAFDGDTVLVADGTYTGDGNRDIDFLGKAITLQSENGPESCIIDCNGTPEDNHRGFYFQNGEDANSVVEGFTIQNGYLSVVSVGGAIFCQRSSPTIANCILKNNSAMAGGGIYCSRSNATISNSIITSNQTNGIGGGIALYLGRNPKVVNCIISYNSGSSGGGINCSDCNAVISNCIIQANSGTEGGGVNAYAWPLRNITISNCLVSGNSAVNGGGLNVVTSTPITNCTIVGNSARRGGGLYKCHATLNNCIIWDNFPQQVVDIYDTTSIIYSNVGGGWVGAGNIDADPCFVEAGYWDVNGVRVEGDYHLWDDSPCIDAGDPNYVAGANETDLDGNPRVIGARIDMGAYEYWPAVQAEMKLTPQSLNCASRGKYIKAHITLPEGFLAEDVDVNEPALAEPVDVESEYIKIPGNGDSPVKVEIGFDRQEFCDRVAETGQMEVTVSGYLTTGQLFIATDTVKIGNRGGRR